MLWFINTGMVTIIIGTLSWRGVTKSIIFRQNKNTIQCHRFTSMRPAPNFRPVHSWLRRPEGRHRWNNHDINSLIFFLFNGLQQAASLPMRLSHHSSHPPYTNHFNAKSAVVCYSLCYISGEAHSE